MLYSVATSLMASPVWCRVITSGIMTCSTRISGKKDITNGRCLVGSGEGLGQKTKVHDIMQRMTSSEKRFPLGNVGVVCCIGENGMLIFLKILVNIYIS